MSLVSLRHDPGNHGSDSSLAQVRWLARDLLPPKLRLLQRLPAPLLMSKELQRSNRAVRNYVLWWLAHPDPGSRFAARTRWVRWLPDWAKLKAIRLLGYDGLIYASGDTILAHVFYQRRRRALFGFSTAVDRSLVGQGLSALTVLDYVAFAAEHAGIERVRLGRGQNNLTRRLLARIKQRETELGWQVLNDGWVVFNRKAPSCSGVPESSTPLRRCPAA
jgi:hypothetical protein